MDASTPRLPLWQTDPFCPPSWRHEDACRLASGREPHWSRNDAATREYAEYLRALDAAKPRADRKAIERGWPGIGEADELYQDNGPRRWHVQARLLMGEGDPEIGRRCLLPSHVVQRFESLHFSVRHCLESYGYIVQRVIGGLDGLGEEQLDRLWMAFAYFGGAPILDSLVDVFLAAWRPGEPATVGVYFREGSSAPLEMQAAIAAHLIPDSEDTKRAFMRMHLQLREIEALGPRAGAAVAKDRLMVETVHLWGCGSTARHTSQQPSRKPIRAKEEKRHERTRASDPAVA